MVLSSVGMIFLEQPLYPPRLTRMKLWHRKAPMLTRTRSRRSPSGLERVKQRTPRLRRNQPRPSLMERKMRKLISDQTLALEQSELETRTCAMSISSGGVHRLVWYNKSRSSSTIHCTTMLPLVSVAPATRTCPKKKR